jgi:hypothetical protein
MTAQQYLENALKESA